MAFIGACAVTFDMRGCLHHLTKALAAVYLIAAAAARICSCGNSVAFQASDLQSISMRIMKRGSKPKLKPGPRYGAKGQDHHRKRWSARAIDIKHFTDPIVSCGCLVLGVWCGVQGVSSCSVQVHLCCHASRPLSSRYRFASYLRHRNHVMSRSLVSRHRFVPWLSRAGGSTSSVQSLRRSSRVA
ncbi:hypothetical protein K461DRAFT_80603 [Myriangium duriaei CBS 260.36]|uniref:Uncharacterized protein n=1 Tax=Myriangium duriaei CBS 260.36 TaxID=1168546 RepID=A0A9P4MQM7_9PEZI|nr:hypothetical protein K461DRAFT_80603 [Myriangium duriaei CBS 260.36]